MAYGSSRLPSRFPVGTKFVIEGKRGGEGQVQVFSRYLEFPDGTFFPLPVRPPSKAAQTGGVPRSPRAGACAIARPLNLPAQRTGRAVTANWFAARVACHVGHWPTRPLADPETRKPRPPVGRG